MIRRNTRTQRSALRSRLNTRAVSPSIARVMRPALLWLLAVACLRGATTYAPANISPPPVTREFRGVWVATLNNIDWPSRRGLTTAEQKQELLALLDQCAALRLNVVIFQVRPGCDAL